MGSGSGPPPHQQRSSSSHSQSETPTTSQAQAGSSGGSSSLAVSSSITTTTSFISRHRTSLSSLLSANVTSGIAISNTPTDDFGPYSELDKESVSHIESFFGKIEEERMKN